MALKQSVYRSVQRAGLSLLKRLLRLKESLTQHFMSAERLGENDHFSAEQAWKDVPQVCAMYDTFRGKYHYYV